MNPNSKAYQAKLKRILRERESKLKELATYPVFQAYVEELKAEKEMLIEAIKSCKSWDQYLEVRAQLRFLEDLIDNSSINLNEAEEPQTTTTNE